MPGYTCSLKHLQKLISKPEVNLDNLEKYLDCAKSEFKGYDAANDELKLENNDTNRPDLWSAEGTARQILGCHFSEIKKYDFFFDDPKKENKVYVDGNIKDIRPYIACMSVSGIAVDDYLLKSIIQSQEKLCDNYGRMRETIAIGVHSADKITLPIYYKGADPKTTKFAPLGFEEEMSLEEILEKHPKGIEYGGIVKGKPLYPFLVDADNKVLSFPPVINSNFIGKVKVGDQNLFVDITGTDREAVLIAANIMACNFIDNGAQVERFEVNYQSGEKEITPKNFAQSFNLRHIYAEKLCGMDISQSIVQNALERMGHNVTISDGIYTCVPAPYRNDILHEADLAEDCYIAMDYNSFQPIMPDSFTVGSESPQALKAAKIRDLLVGMNFQEVMTYILTSKANQCEKMEYTGEIAEIGNPMTETFGAVRERLLPILLEIESKNPRAEYPHRIFETGETAVIDLQSNDGTRTLHKAAALIAHSTANFSEIHSILQALLYYMNIPYKLQETDHPSFISGRCGKIYTGSEEIGIIGEIHPKVLENWAIMMPCSAFELFI